MEQIKFTSKLKSEVCKDWLSYIPGLSKYKTSILFNKIGPLLVGVSFKYSGLQRMYTPIYSVHNLTRDFNSISCTLCLNADIVKIENYKETFKKRADFLKNHAYIPMEGDLNLEQIISGYEKFFEESDTDCITECEDLILLCGWCKNKEKLEYCLDLVKNKLKKLDEVYFCDEGGFDNWYNDLKVRASDGDKLRQICDEQIKSLKLEKIAIRELIY